MEPEVPVWQQLAILALFAVFVVFLAVTAGSWPLAFADCCVVVALVVWQVYAAVKRGD